ncbi:hypothetical protein SAMN05216388_1003166 [Halorientalis persicus]|uniref:Uncharacterized protein n=1 Tax=Halorientalis persicus TaxID=1367881 RepID=A0A1H8GRU0_9EURY|nr:hypothetical protein [Halorientalis persicus]SEN45988.1 hypothetical protein SAMN05216388_1003166 [Halorientalis persicus]
MDRRLLVACCLALVALAGCSGGPGGPTPTAEDGTPTATPANGDGEPTETTNLTLSVGAEVEASALVRAHETALANESYAFRSGYGLASGAREQASTRLRADDGLFEIERFQYHPRRGEAAALYAREGREYVRFEDGPVTKTVAQPNRTAVPTGRQALVGVESLTVTDTIQRDGETRYVLTTGYDYETADQTLPYRRAVVDERGQIHNYTSGEYVPPESDRPGEGLLVSRWFDLSNVGETTVDEPDWLTDLRTTESDGLETVVVEHAALDTRFRVTGTDVDASVEAVTNDAVVGSDHVDESRASALIDLDIEGQVTNATVRVGYDSAALPGGASEQGLAVFVYNESLQTYLPLNTSLDTDAKVAVASRGPPVRYSSGGGPEQTLRPTLSDPTADRLVVAVMHAETWYAAFR